MHTAEETKTIKEAEEEYYRKRMMFERSGKQKLLDDSKKKRYRDDGYSEDDDDDYFGGDDLGESDDGGYKEKNKNQDDGDLDLDDMLFGGKGPDRSMGKNAKKKAGKGPAVKRVHLKPSVAKERLSKIWDMCKDPVKGEELAKTALEALSKEHHVDHLIKSYLAHFHDGKVVDCKTRLFIPTYLVESLGLDKATLLEAFKYRCKKMINLHADYPAVFKYYGFFMRSWCLEKKYYTLQELCGHVDIGVEEYEDGTENEAFYDD